jgi:hypothetical protein
MKNEPNKAMEPIPVSVTISAAQKVAPLTSMAHLGRSAKKMSSVTKILFAGACVMSIQSLWMVKIMVIDGWGIYIPASEWLSASLVWGATLWIWLLYSRSKRTPNQPPQRNAGSRPSSDVSSASETPSSLGPRG